MHSISNTVITCTIMHSSHTRPSASKEDLTRYVKREKSFLPFFFPLYEKSPFLFRVYFSIN